MMSIIAQDLSGNQTDSILCENNWCWGEKPGIAKEKNALYTDAMKLEKYKEAVEPLEWLLENTPNLNKSIYINGVKIYSSLAKIEEDSLMKVSYQNKEIELYMKRIEYYGEEEKVLQRAGAKVYSYWKKDDSKKLELFDFYNRIKEVAGNNTKDLQLIIFNDHFFECKN